MPLLGSVYGFQLKDQLVSYYYKYSYMKKIQQKDKSPRVDSIRPPKPQVKSAKNPSLPKPGQSQSKVNTVAPFIEDNKPTVRLNTVGGKQPAVSGPTSSRSIAKTPQEVIPTNQAVLDKGQMLEGLKHLYQGKIQSSVQETLKLLDSYEQGKSPREPELEQVTKQQLQQLEESEKQLQFWSEQKPRGKTSLNLPLSSDMQILTDFDQSAPSSRSLQSRRKLTRSKEEMEKDPSVDLNTPNRNEQMRRVMLGPQAKQSLMRIQKYDKEIGCALNEKQLKGTMDNEARRLEKIKNTYKSMKGSVFDNEITINAIANILRYQQELNNDVKTKVLLQQENKTLQFKMGELEASSAEEIRNLKVSFRQESNKETARNKTIEAQIKDFHKSNQQLVPMIKEGSYEKIKKYLEVQIKKLSNNSNKELALNRKELLQIILTLLLESQPQQLTNSVTPSSMSSLDLKSLNSSILPVFEPQSSIQNNIAHLQKHKRNLETKTLSPQLKEVHQTISQGCNYIVGLYQELKNKSSQVQSLNKKIADLEGQMQRNEKLRVETIEKKDRLVQQLKGEIQIQRRQSKQMTIRINSMSKQKGTGKVVRKDVPEGLQEWSNALDTLISKIENGEQSWSGELTKIRKQFVGKKDLAEFKSLLANDLRMLDLLVKRDKDILQLESLRVQLEKKQVPGTKLEFKSSDMERKFSLEKEKVEGLQTEKTALLKSLKQLHREKEKTKDPQYDQILGMNKICCSIDTMINTPFNKDTWQKILIKLQNKAELKDLLKISDTLQATYTKLYAQLLESKMIKQQQLKPTVRQIVKESNKKQKYGDEKLIMELFALLKEIVENESEFGQYIEVLNMLPPLLTLLADKLKEREQSAQRICQLEVETEEKQNRIQALELSLSRVSEHETQAANNVNCNVRTELQDLNEQVVRLKQQALQSRQKLYMKYRILEQQKARKESELLSVVQTSQAQLDRMKQILFFRKKESANKQQQLEQMKNLLNKKDRQIEKLNHLLEEARSRETRNIDSQTQLVEVNEVVTRQDQKPAEQDTQPQALQTHLPIIIQGHPGRLEQLLEQVSLKEQQITHLKQWISAKDQHISTHQVTVKSLRDQVHLQQKTIAQNEQKQLLFQAQRGNLEQPKQDETQRLFDTFRQQSKEEMQVLGTLVEEYRLKFQYSCAQMEEMHLGHEGEMESVTQMGLRTQMLLEEEIDILKKQKTKSQASNLDLQNKLGELAQKGTSSREYQAEVESRLSQLKQEKQVSTQLLAQTTEECTGLVTQLGLYQRENTTLKERVITLENKIKQDESSGELRRSFSSAIDKKKKRIANRPSHKSNKSRPDAQSPNNELANKLTTLLERDGKLSVGSLRQIVEAINTLITSNKKLIERVKRGEKQNSALYEAINNLTAEQQQFGEGISIIMHLQRVMSDLSEWLEGEAIATEEELKVCHFFQRLQGCVSKNNYSRYVEIFQEFLQHTVCVVFEHGEEELQMQNKQIDSLREKLMVALDEHLHDIIDQEKEETDGEQDKVLSQVRVLLGVFLKTRNLKVIEDLMEILNVSEVSFTD